MKWQVTLHECPISLGFGLSGCGTMTLTLIDMVQFSSECKEATLAD